MAETHFTLRHDIAEVIRLSYPIEALLHGALSLMEGSNEYLVRSGFTFNQSTAHYYAQIEEVDPALFEKIAAKVKAWRS